MVHEVTPLRQGEVVLRRQGRFSEVAALDHATGELRPLSGDPSGFREHGDFTELGGQVMAVYRRGEDLFVRLGEQAVRVTPGLRAELSGRIRKRLRLVDGDRAVAEVRYRRPLGSFAYRFDSLAYQDDATHDFGTLVAQIVNRPEGHDGVFPAGRDAAG